jgi:putative glutamine amidotransferase
MKKARFESGSGSGSGSGTEDGVAGPIIGIEADIDRAPKTGRRFAKVYEDYYEAVAAAGGTPVLLPPLSSPEHAARALEVVDALVFPGGGDLPPEEYGASPVECPRYVPVDPGRLRAGRELLVAAARSLRPVLGVCYGHQLLNVVLGGDMVQDIPLLVAGSLDHAASGAVDSEHEVTLEPRSRLAELVGSERVRVNSAHHQSVGRAGAGLRIVARSSDGIVEAVEAEDPSHFLVGVQWHPERLGPGPAGLRLFEALVEAARERRRDR